MGIVIIQKKKFCRNGLLVQHETTAFWPHLLQSTTQGTLLQDAVFQQDTENNHISASVTTESVPLNYAFV